MKIKRFVAKDIRQAMKMVKDELGADAVIMSNRSVEDGVEIVAARDFDEEVIHDSIKSESKPAPRPKKSMDLLDFDAGKEKLHILSSQRKPSAEHKLPTKKPVNRDMDKYVGYAEKISLTSQHYKKQLQDSEMNTHRATPHDVAATYDRPLKSNLSSARPVNNRMSKPQKPRSFAEPEHNDSSMLDMRGEIKALKSALDSKLAEVGWSQNMQANPVRIDLLRRLTDMGISKRLSVKIANRLSNHQDVNFAFAKAKETLAKVTPLHDDNLMEYGGIVALVGPTGVGKTTTIAKLAGQYIMRHGSRQVALITTDNYRIGAYEQLMTYGRLLDVPVRSAGNAQELHNLINSFSDKSLILIDTAGMSQRDMRLAEQIQTLQQQHIPIKSYLVMSAATQYKIMNEIIHAFKIFEPEACILTKLDEALSPGSALSSIIENQLPIGFLTNGQQVPEDIYVPDVFELLEECVSEDENGDNGSLNYEDWVVQGYA